MTPFPYALREREWINDLLEALCGARLTYNYHRIGGVGWDMTLYGLALHISTGAPNDAGEFMAWVGSPEGKGFIRHSSDDWCRASIDGGTDPDMAKGSAARTTAAYTGDAVPESTD